MSSSTKEMLRSLLPLASALAVVVSEKLRTQSVLICVTYYRCIRKLGSLGVTKFGV